MKLILLFIFSVPHFIQAQKNAGLKETFTNQDSISYLKRSMAFIQQVMQKELLDSNFTLVDDPYPAYYEDFLNTLLTVPNLFSKDEIMMIQQREYPAALKWKAEWFKHAKVLNSDTIAAIFKLKSKGWPYFHKKHGKGYRNLSMPIFLRNDSVCIFYSDIYSGQDSQDGSMFMYRKEKEVWTRIKYPQLTWVV